MKTVLEFNDKFLPKLIAYYHGFEIKPTTEHIKHLFKSDYFTITVYKSNKVLFQGEDAVEEYNQWAVLLKQEPLLPKPIPLTSYVNEYYNKSVIGSDEVGTGDFFGPVIVTAAFIGPQDYAFLKDYNIQDSKNISDDIIKQIAPILIKEIPHHTLTLNNIKYNDLTDKGYNMNKIKAYLHNHALKKLMLKVKNFDQIIVDQFCSLKNYQEYLKDQEMVPQTELIEKAESVHQAVAVAAIIARYTFLEEMDKLSEKIAIVLPKGAGPQVDAIGKLITLKLGKNIFREIAKLNFKNTKKIWD